MNGKCFTLTHLLTQPIDNSRLPLPWKKVAPDKADTG
jgi:hypothetical protein